MSFDGDLSRFAVKLDRTMTGLLPAVAAAVHESIVSGSELTGAPGQPVGQYGPGYHVGEVGGTLKQSYTISFPAPDVAVVGTNLVYAPMNEYGVTESGAPYRQRSSVGGRYSVALTRAGFGALVDHEVKRLAGRGA